MTDYDARLAEVYDSDNPDGPDHDFYRNVAHEVDAASILDIGAGTGILTVSFARTGRTVVGIDPSETRLDYARRRAGGDRVTWVRGDSRDAHVGPYDLAVLTGNVVQHIPDPDWTRTLADIHLKMVPGGVLAFDTRNPGGRAWTTWTSAHPTERMTPFGMLREWSEAEEVTPGHVRLAEHARFLNSGDTVTDVAMLCFRERATIEHQLVAAGFEVDAVFGDWHRTPFTDDAPLMTFVAIAR